MVESTQPSFPGNDAPQGERQRSARPWHERLRAPGSLWLSKRAWLGLLLSIACLALALYDIDLGEVGATLRSANLALLLVAALTVLAAGVAKTVRWRILLGGASAGGADAIALPRLSRIWYAGAALNLALPAPRSGDLARAYLVAEGASGLSKSLALGTVAVEKLLDMVMLAGCLLGLVLLMTLPPELGARRAPVVGATLAVLAGVALILWQRERLLRLARWLLSRLPGGLAPWGQRLLGSTERAVQGLAALRSPRAIAALVIWTVGIWLASTYTNFLVLRAMGLDIDRGAAWVLSIFVLVVLQAGVAIPSSPGKVGVFQVLCRWALGVFGLPATVGLAYGILLYLVAPVTLMVVGTLALAWESWQLRTHTPAEREGLD